MKIYVGNLAHDVSSEELQAEFAAFGKVEVGDFNALLRFV